MYDLVVEVIKVLLHSLFAFNLVAPSSATTPCPLLCKSHLLSSALFVPHQHASKAISSHASHLFSLATHFLVGFSCSNLQRNIDASRRALERMDFDPNRTAFLEIPAFARNVVRCVHAKFASKVHLCVWSRVDRIIYTGTVDTLGVLLFIVL